MADTPTAFALKRLASRAQRLHREIAAAMVYDQTEPAMVRAERAMVTVEQALAEALHACRGTDG